MERGGYVAPFMAALAIALTFMVLLLSVLVLGLLRSHADILRALHSLGAGIGDPDTDESTSTSIPVTMGPTLPRERHSDAPDISGTTPTGGAVVLSMRAADLTLLAFLSSGCSTCAGFWEGLTAPESFGVPAGTRLAVVTQGPEHELPAAVARLAPANIDVLLSTDAWIDYEVPGAPYFALVDGRSGRRIGEGLASSVEQVAGLIRRAVVDTGVAAPRRPEPHLAGPEREDDNDQALLAAGISPGDPSLYPPRVSRS